MKLRIGDAAYLQVRDAGRYIERQTRSYRWVKAVLAEFRTACRAIAAHPEMAPFVDEEGVPPRRYREVFLKRFQYRIIDEIDGGFLNVVAFVHAARDPGSWQ